MSQSPAAPVVVTLAGKEYTLQTPSSFLVREAIQTEVNRVLASEDRDDAIIGSIVWAALVGVYVPQILPADLTLKGHKYKVQVYGEAAYEYLREQGYKPAEIMAAGMESYNKNRDSLAPREHEVAEETGNS